MIDELHHRLADALAGPGHRPIRVIGPCRELTGGWAGTSLHTCPVSTGPVGGQPTVDAPEQAVLKMYGADEEGVAHAIREWRALTVLNGSGCRVPTVLAFSAEPGPVGRPFLLMDHIAGRSFWSGYEAADPAARSASMSSFVDQLSALHAVDPRRLDPVAAARDGRDILDAELTALRRDAAASPGWGLLPAVAWTAERGGAVPLGPPVILHRDYHPWNVVVDDRSALWVLDWDWQLGDPRFDLAWTGTLMARSGHDAFSRAFTQEYGRRIGHRLDDLDFFEVVTTIRWLLNVLPALGPDSRLDEVKRAAFRTFLQQPLHRARGLLRQHTGVAPALLT